MNSLSDFEIKQRKHTPAFPKASGKPTPYLPGYPYEDDEPMTATGYHAEQIVTLANPFFRYKEPLAHERSTHTFRLDTRWSGHG